MLRGRPDAFLMDDLRTHGRLPNDGRPSYVGLTFLVLDDSYGRIGDSSILVHHQLQYA